ncbi:MAG: polyribonucleotide nucleotidyltransferase, partial [Planctomycetota bacterium]
MQKKEYTLDLEGKIITASFTDLVDQANGSVMLSCENTVVLATAVMSKSGKHNPGYFDLQVSYEERFYAGGEILGARYTRREGRPSTRAVLSSRIIDRTLRPLFAHHIRNAVQIVITVLSVGTYDPTLLGINAASLAIATSNIPWAGPVAGVQLLAVSGEEYHINTTRDKGTVYETDLVVCGRGGTINMIEAATYEVSEDHAIKALQTAEPLILQLEEWQKGIVAEIGKEKITIETPTCPQDVLDLFDKTMRPKMLVELFGEDSKTRIDTLEGEWDGIVDEMYPGDDEDTHNTRRLGAYHFHTMVDEILHEAALTENKRADLRAMDEVRDLYAQVGGISPLLHGTGIFYRGGTHMLTVLTLAGPDKKLLEEGMEVQEEKDFFHHYNFPPYSAGETGRIGGANRRAIGHGMLAEKALAPVLPNKTDFPYTMRLVSESMASNGSTSQAAI